MANKILPIMQMHVLPALISRTTLGANYAELELHISQTSDGHYEVDPYLTNYMTEEGIDREGNKTFENAVFHVDSEELLELVDNLLLELPNFDYIEGDVGIDVRDRFKTAFLGHMEDALAGTSLSVSLFCVSKPEEMTLTSSLVLGIEVEGQETKAYQSILNTEIRSVFE